MECLISTCFNLPGVPTTTWGQLFFNNSIWLFMGIPPKKLPTLTPLRYTLNLSNSWQICIKTISVPRRFQAHVSLSEEIWSDILHHNKACQALLWQLRMYDAYTFDYLYMKNFHLLPAVRTSCNIRLHSCLDSGMPWLWLPLLNWRLGMWSLRVPNLESQFSSVANNDSSNLAALRLQLLQNR